MKLQHGLMVEQFKVFKLEGAVQIRALAIGVGGGAIASNFKSAAVLAGYGDDAVSVFARGHLSCSLCRRGNVDHVAQGKDTDRAIYDWCGQQSDHFSETGRRAAAANTANTACPAERAKAARAKRETREADEVTKAANAARRAKRKATTLTKRETEVAKAATRAAAPGIYLERIGREAAEYERHERGRGKRERDNERERGDMIKRVCKRKRDRKRERKRERDERESAVRVDIHEMDPRTPRVRKKL